MKKILLLTAIAAVVFSFKAIEEGVWTVDQVHSRFGFSIVHQGISDFEGSFKTYECTIKTPKEDFSDAVMELTADMNSINTDNEKRDMHVKGPDFFDAAKYPKLTFKSKSFKPEGANKYKIVGDLTMHGITKEITLEATCRTGINGKTKKPMAGLHIYGTIKRTDFGIATGMPATMLSDEVMLNANGEFAKN